MKIDISILNWLQNQSVSEYELIEYNEAKGRYCLSFVANNGEKRFLKWNQSASDTQRFHQHLLEKEKTVYEILKDKGITPLYIEDPDMFVTEYLSGKSLRATIKELIKEKDILAVESIVKETVEKWLKFVSCLRNANVGYQKDIHPYNEYNQYLGKLLLSGPFETKKLVRLEKVLNTVINKCFKLLYGNKIQKNLSRYGYDVMPMIHGDFHANNVLVSSQGVYLFDLENVRRGMPEIELAYFYAQVRLLIKGENDLLVRLDRYIKEEVNIKKEVFFQILDIYCKAISFNRRFY